MISWSFKLFLLVYCVIGCLNVLIQNFYFAEYGVFHNDNPIVQLFIILASVLLIAGLIRVSRTSKYISIKRIVVSVFFYYAVYVFYCLIFLYSLVDFISSAHYYMYFESSLPVAMAHVGYTVANLESKRSFAFLYFLCFVFAVFSYSGRGFISWSSILLVALLFVIFVLSGRKEQAISSLLVLFVSLNSKFKINIKIVSVLLVIFIGCIFVSLNLVRGGASGSFYDFFLNSQEFYPVVFGSYIRLLDDYYLQSIPLGSFVSTYIPMVEKMGFPNALVYISKLVFNEAGYGPTFSIIGLLSIFPISTTIVLLIIFFTTNIIINSLKKLGEIGFPMRLYIFIKVFFLFRNGLVYYYIWDLLIILLFSLFALIFVEKNNEKRRSCCIV